MSRGIPDRSQVIRRYLATQLLWGHHLAQKLGIGDTELATLMHISLNEEVTPGQLVQATGLSAAAVTRMVDRLVERGFVVRVNDEVDRRRVLIRQTDRWLATIDTVVEPHRRAMRSVIGGLDPDAQRAVMEYMAGAAPAVRALLDE